MKDKRIHLSLVGYNSTVDAFKIFPAIPAHMKIINEQACANGTSVKSHPIAPIPPPTNTMTAIQYKKNISILNKICGLYG